MVHDDYAKIDTTRFDGQTVFHMQVWDNCTLYGSRFTLREINTYEVFTTCWVLLSKTKNLNNTVCTVPTKVYN